MEAEITIKMDNAAFEEAPASELSRILIDLAHRIESGDGAFEPIKLRDVNGNAVGMFEVKD